MSHFLKMPGISENSRGLLKQLLEEALIPVEALPHVIESYRRVIHDAQRKGRRVNTAVGDQIAAALQGLLKSVGPKTGEDNLRIIQAAVRYFVIQDDGAKHDFATMDGLDDDARVVNAALRFFGLDQLQIPDIPPLEGPPTSRTARGAAPAAPAKQPRAKTNQPYGGAATPPPPPAPAPRSAAGSSRATMPIGRAASPQTAPVPRPTTPTRSSR